MSIEPTGLLMVGSGLCWSITYILIIRRCYLDRTYGMPLPALCANLSWEFIFTFIHPPHVTGWAWAIYFASGIAWFSLDLVIFGQFLRYGRGGLKNVPAAQFYPWAALVFATAFGFERLVPVDQDYLNPTLLALGQNLMMSMMFIAMLYYRQSLRGQSLSIALFKLIGTGCASLSCLLTLCASTSAPPVPLLPLPNLIVAATPICRADPSIRSLLLFLCIAIFVFDVIYIAYAYVKHRAAATKPGKILAAAYGPGETEASVVV